MCFLFGELVINMPILLHLLITYVSMCYPHFRYLGSISRHIFIYTYTI